MGIPTRDYSDFWSDEAASETLSPARPPNLRTTGSSMLFSPQRGYSARPMLATRFDGFGQRFAEFQAKNDLADLAAKEEVLSPAFDPFSPEGQQKRVGHVLRGTISPQQEGLLRDLENPPQNRYSPVPVDVVKAASMFDTINPADPKAWETFSSIMGQIDSDPAIAESGVKAHPFFTDKADSVRQSILMFRPRGEDAMDDRLWFAMKGGNPADFDAGKFNTPEGKADRAAMAFHLSQLKNARLSNDEMDQLQLAAEEVGVINESRARSAFESRYDKEPSTPEEWLMAQQLAFAETAPQRQALANVIRDLEGMGRAVPPRFKELLGVSPAAPQEGSVQTQPDRPVITTREQYDALPPGTPYVDSKGNKAVKK